jgi:hypothetical protein
MFCKDQLDLNIIGEGFAESSRSRAAQPIRRKALQGIGCNAYIDQQFKKHI